MKASLNLTQVFAVRTSKPLAQLLQGQTLVLSLPPNRITKDLGDGIRLSPVTSHGLWWRERTWPVSVEQRPRISH